MQDRVTDSYYGKRIGNRSQTFEWYKFEGFQDHDIIQRQITKKTGTR